MDSDSLFVKRLLTAAFGRFTEYYDKVAGSVRGWDRDRLFTTDIASSRRARRKAVSTRPARDSFSKLKNQSI